MMLSTRQFAVAVGASEKWVDNTSRSLARRGRTEENARYLRLVREMSSSFEMSITRAAQLATRVLALDPHSTPTPIASSHGGALHIVVDLERHLSRFAVALAAAQLEGPYQKGPYHRTRLPRRAQSRPAILMRASALGLNTSLLRGLARASPAERVAALGEQLLLVRDLVDSCIPLVVIGDVAAVARGVSRAAPRLEVRYAAHGDTSIRLASLLVSWDARPLDVARDYPFVRDQHTVAGSPVLALTTRFGPVVLRQTSNEEFATLSATATMLDLGGFQALVLTVEALIADLRTSLRPIPATAIPELEAAAVVLKRVD